MIRGTTLVQVSLVCLAFLANGCIDAAQEGEDTGGGEQLGETEQGIGNTYDIGIIPSSTSCPDGGPLREIHMDNEDGKSGQLAGWVGATVGTANTTFRFCRVDGARFFPLAWASPENVSAYYAVLKMGSQCPNGSFEFMRHFDNEDYGNGNWSSGDIEPSSVTSNTNMVFCLFKYAINGGATMGSFPYQAISYGVFADYSSELPLAIDKGYVFTNDEDTRNANSYTANIDWRYDAQRIISGGSNTYLDMVRVQ